MNNPDLGKISKNSRITVLSGAGMSAESGLKTFRDHDGLWEHYSIYEVATPEAWQRDPRLVLRFYDERRKQLLHCQPNEAHKALTALEEKFDVHIITQNIDDLHERAGSEKVLHLHGELRKARSSTDENLIYEIDGWQIPWGSKCERGSQLRPHVVWFGEAVPMIEAAANLVEESDVLIVIGTSLNVYPAAGLLHSLSPDGILIAIDPSDINLNSFPQAIHIREKAVKGVKNLVKQLLTHAT